MTETQPSPAQHPVPAAQAALQAIGEEATFLQCIRPLSIRPPGSSWAQLMHALRHFMFISWSADQGGATITVVLQLLGSAMWAGFLTMHELCYMLEVHGPDEEHPLSSAPETNQQADSRNAEVATRRLHGLVWQHACSGAALQRVTERENQV